MNQWAERISSHPIWEELKLLGAAIDRATLRDLADIDPPTSIATIDGLARVRAILAFCGKRLAAVDPILIEPAALGKLTQALIAARADIEVFTLDGPPAHIVNANTNADQALIALASILTPVLSDDLSTINGAASAYHATVDQYLLDALATQQLIKKASDENTIKISALEAALTSEQQKLATLVLDYQSQYSASQDRRASEFSAIITDYQSKAAANTAEQQSLFSSDQDARRAEFVKTQSDHQVKVSELITEFTQTLKVRDDEFAATLKSFDQVQTANLDTLKTEYEHSAKLILNQIEAHKTAVEKLVGVIGNLGVTSGYQKVANLARRMLFVWQTVTIVALGGLIFVAYQMAFPKPNNIVAAIKLPQTISVNSNSPIAKPDPTSIVEPQPVIQDSMQTITPINSDSTFYRGLATRFFLSLTFGIFAAYAASQASHFLNMERKNRRLALELEALGPYIAALPEDMQNKFRIDIGERSFGVPDNDSHKHKEKDPVTAIGALNPKELGDLIASIVKAMKRSGSD